LPSDHLLDPVDVQQLRPDLVILDLVLMGQSTGWDYLGQLRARSSTARLPILVCSGYYPSVDNATGAERTSATGVLLKPFELQYFLDTVAAAIRNGHPTPPSGRMYGSTAPAADGRSLVSRPG
jgi:DNA-binding response OmpR family regulator